MRIFVTGATGYIGTCVVNNLIEAGHQVIGLTRSDEGEMKLKESGAEVLRGDLNDLDILRKGAELSDGVIHLAFHHDFSKFAESLETDLKVIQTIGEVLEGTGKTFVSTAHVNGTASDNEMMELAKRGVRTSVAMLAPSVHGDGDNGFIPQLINIARNKGFSAYVGDGTNHWTAVHKLDAANLFRLAIEHAPAGSYLDGVADEKVPFREISEVIGKKLNIPIVSIPHEEAASHFGFLSTLAGLDIPRSSMKTQEILKWTPIRPNLIANIEEGHYFH